MLDAVKWLERIVDELSHKRRKELYQEWLRDWTMTGVITYEINFSEVAQTYEDEAAQKQHLANEEYKVALQLASQMIDPAVMAARMLPSKLPVMKRELMVICLRTRAVTAKERGEEKSNLVILPTPKRVENAPESVSNPTQPVPATPAEDDDSSEPPPKSAA